MGGHAQTLLTELKDENLNLRYPKIFEFKYDERELFTLSDGG